MPRPGPTEIVRWIAATELFSSLPESGLSRIAAGSRLVELEPGAFLFRKGEVPRSLDIVVSGRVHVTTTGRDGNELLLGVLESGELVGEVAAIDGQTRCTNAVAEQTSRVLRVSLVTALDVLGDHAEAALGLSRMLTRHVRNAVLNIENVGLEKARTRLWSRLMLLSVRYSKTDETTGAMRIEHGLSQQKLADSVGLTRVLVNRQLSSWREQGLVETGRGFVLLRDPEALERFVWADSDPVAHRTGAHLIESEAAEASRRRAEADESGE